MADASAAHAPVSSFFFSLLPFVLLLPIVFQLVLHVIPQDDMINGPGASDDDDDYRHRLIMTIIATICYCNAVTAPSNLLFFSKLLAI